MHVRKVDSHEYVAVDQIRTLLYLYGSLIRSKLDYECIVYGSARKPYDPIQYYAHRLCLDGAFRHLPLACMWKQMNLHCSWGERISELLPHIIYASATVLVLVSFRGIASRNLVHSARYINWHLPTYYNVYTESRKKDNNVVLYMYITFANSNVSF